MTEARIIIALFSAISLFLCGMVLLQGDTIRQQRDLIRRMETNPKCMVAPTAGNRG